MESPAKDAHADLIIEALEGDVVVIAEATLPSDNRQAFDRNVEADERGGTPPNDWIANQVNLTLLRISTWIKFIAEGTNRMLPPEIDTALQEWPGWWSRVPGVRLGQTCVGPPHDLLQLPEFSEETRVPVVNLLSVFFHERVNIAFDVPYAVGECSTTSTRHLLLLETPIREFDLVREQNASRHDMDKPEFGLDSADTLLCDSSIRVGLDDFNLEHIVGITLETFISVRGDLVLPVGFSDRRTNVVRV
jgi:hypothetical protein